MRTLRYVRCDVFTDRPLAGNALGVFTDARALDEATMQALAREMNLSECTFVLRPTSKETADARIRIFTPTREIPFAGHPTLGTAFVLGPPLQRDLVRLETGRGVVPVRMQYEAARPVFGWMAQPLPTWAAAADPAPVLRALGVARSTLPIELYDNGPHHLFVTLPSHAAVAALRPDLGALARAGDFGVSTCALENGRWKTRMFAPGHGVPEDPATGSAAGPLAVHAVRHGLARFGDELLIEQGVEIARPSVLHARVHGDTANGVTAVEVGGAAVVVARGEFVLP